MNFKNTICVFVFLFLNSACVNKITAQQTLGLFINDSISFNGYTLWSPNTSTYLIDNCGFLVNQWSSNHSPGLSAYITEQGTLMRAGNVQGNFNGPGRGGIIEEFDWDGNLIWSYRVANSDFHQHHDIEPMPNGNVLVIAWERKTSGEAVEAGSMNNSVYWPEVIFELEKVGFNDANVVWEWHQWDHLIQEHDSTKMNFGVVEEHPELLDVNYRAPSGGGFASADWQHFNGIDFDPVRDEIILSSRNMSEIYVIDHSTTTAEAAGHTGGNSGKGGDFLYRWGNPLVYKRGTIDDKKLFGQHNAEVVPEGYPDEGKITIFNNGSGRPVVNYSSIDMIDPPKDITGNYMIEPFEAIGPATLFWQYRAENLTDFYSNNMAGAHRLPNGNTMICSANDATFFEVTETGEIVWLYQNTAGSGGPFTRGQTGGFGFATSVFKAIRYAPDYPGLIDKDLTPGDPVELEPIDTGCIIYDGINVSTEELFLTDVKIIFDSESQRLEIINPLL